MSLLAQTAANMIRGVPDDAKISDLDNETLLEVYRILELWNANSFPHLTAEAAQKGRDMLRHVKAEALHRMGEGHANG